MTTIGFLHTSPLHVPIFERLVAEIAPGTHVVASVDESLLARARRDGVDDATVASSVERALVELVSRGADRVVCTCSTIGGVAEAAGRRRGLDVTRVDRPMAELAVAAGTRIAIVVAVESTVEPTRALLAEVAATAGRAVELSVHLVPHAWDRFEAGDHEGYVRAIVDAVREIAPTVDVVVLAQASMAPAAALAGGGVPVLASPRTAVELLAGQPAEQGDAGDAARTPQA